MWGTSTNNIWRAGANGNILHYDWTSYEVFSSGTDQTLRGMWGDSEDYIFAVGDGGSIVHYNGSGWSVMDSGTSEDLKDIWGSRAVVATRLQSWAIETLSDLISLRCELIEYQGEPFEISRTEFSSPPNSIGIGDGEIDRDGMTFGFEDRGIEAGKKYAYAVKIVCDDGSRTLFESDPVEVPLAPLSLVHYPNPFNPSTVIRYMIPEASEATLCIYDVNGKHVRTLVDKALEPASYAVEWNGTNDGGDQLPSGIYILSLKAGKERSHPNWFLSGREQRALQITCRRPDCRSVMRRGQITGSMRFKIALFV